MKNISRFDLTMIIIFVVVGLLGGGAWYYLSGQLDTAKQDVSSAASDFDKYSSKEVYLPTASNLKTLESNITLLKAQLDPLIHSKLQPENGKLAAVAKQDTVAWKHDLDAEMLQLNAAAKLHGVKVPDNFYFGFSRYLSQAPGEEKTAVLSKQLLAIQEIATILINAPVKNILAVRRTYEEDGPSNSSVSIGGPRSDTNFLGGNAAEAAGGAYTSYPFEVEFEGDADGLRKVINDLTQSSYIFVVRALAIDNSQPNSPKIHDLDKMAGTEGGAVVDSTPGSVAANKSDKGPQFLFGGETLHVKARIDLIEWEGISSPSTPAPNGTAMRPPTTGANP